MKTYLGIDTSCYTTSVALVDSQKRLLADQRIMLDVKQGEKGLRQSDAVFQHIKNCGEIFERMNGLFSESDIFAVSASIKPRSVTGSYMPVFVVGQNIAQTICAVNDVPFYGISHQQNHLIAGVWSAGGPVSRSFIAVHLSGGTTELLHVAEENGEFTVQTIGGSSDISAGQFLDRIGVAMGLPFPSGVFMEKLALEAGTLERRYKIPFTVDELRISFSGPESHARRLLEKGADKAGLALSVLDCISRGVADLLKEGCRRTGLNEVLLMGGVSSNSYIKERLQEQLDCRLYFPLPCYCKDGAVGTALFALRMAEEK